MSELCLGAGVFAEPGWGADLAESRRVIEAYYDAGGRFIDVANKYAGGRSEEYVGAVVKDRRDEVVLATKYTAVMRDGDVNSWGNHRKNLRSSLDASLRRLQSDYVDLLWVHAWDEITPLEEIMRVLDDAVRDGKVLYVGVSNTPAWAISRAQTIAELRGWSPFAAMQINYNLAERTAENELLPLAQHLGMAFLAWSPLAAGTLTGGSVQSAVRYRHEGVPLGLTAAAEKLKKVAQVLGESPAAVALAWFRYRGSVPIIPVLGARKPEYLQDGLHSLEVSLDSDILAELDTINPPPATMPRAFTESPQGVEFMHAGLRTLMKSVSDAAAQR